MSRIQFPNGFGAPQPQPMMIAAPVNDMQVMALMMAVMDKDPNRAVPDLYDRASEMLLESFRRREEFQNRVNQVLAAEKLAAQMRDKN